MVIDGAMELEYYLTWGDSFVGSNIAEEPAVIFPILERILDERLLSVSIIEENFGQQQF